MSYRIGIDVGGTNTDAVLLDQNLRVISKVKSPTTKDVMQGIANAIELLLKDVSIDRSQIRYAMLGTTHCTNAIVERKNLNKVGIIRLAGPATNTVPPMAGWPEDLKEAIGTEIYFVSGGYEYDGRPISVFDENEFKTILEQLRGKVDSIAITGVFSPVKTDQEMAAKALVETVSPDIPISLSHEIGSVGLIERENATILNAALTSVIHSVAEGFEKALASHHIKANIYFGQNDGTLMSKEYALKYPIFTIACGPTNSIRGALHLSGMKDAIVVDVGGTTTDIGVLQKGFPRQSSIAVDIGGVRTNFRMPDILSIGLGGGTIIHQESNHITIGPESVGYELVKKGMIFGGDTLTASDVAVALGQAHIPNTTMPTSIEQTVLKEAYRKMIEMVEDAIDQMKTTPDPVPILLVGGGSIILPNSLKGVSDVIRPEHFDVANAIGAALGDISGETEKVYSLDDLTYQEALEHAKEHAVSEAILAGADPSTVELVSIEDIPLSYLPGNAVLIKAKAAGKLKLS